jgi:putative Mg2+ transporter-C (MgtC) family protein
MPLTLHWQDVTLRLALTVLAGALVGINRSERGKVAGLCTTVLVCLAASVSMIQTNLLLETAGRAPDSFITLDLMRLPLGILTGMGFIGAGAILRRGDLVVGVTTASTLWLVTVIGLCIGGGQIAVGLVALALGLGVLWGLKEVEVHLHQERRATLVLTAAADGPPDEDIRATIESAGYRIASWDAAYRSRGKAPRRTVRCEVRWRGPQRDVQSPAFLKSFAQSPGVVRLSWQAMHLP